MFIGGGFGVGLTVAELAVPCDGGSSAERPARLSELLPVESRTDAELATELQRVQRVRARLDA